LVTSLVAYVIGHISEGYQHRAWLVLGWVTISGWVNHLSM